MTKPKSLASDEKFRRIWQACVEADREVRSWPPWKRSEDVQGFRPPVADDPPEPTPER